MLRAFYFFFGLVWMAYALSTFHMNDLARHSIQLLACKFFFFYSFAYTTSPAAVMKLVVFFRSSKPPYNFW